MVTFELQYNAPDGSVGTWHKDGFAQLEDDGGGGAEEERHLLGKERGSDTDSLPSSPSKSFRGSKLSIVSRGSAVLKSPKA